MRCSPDGATRAITDVRVRATLLILERTGRPRRYLMHDLVRLYSSAEIAEQWGFRDIPVMLRLQKKPWRRRPDTSRAMLRGLKSRVWF